MGCTSIKQCVSVRVRDNNHTINCATYSGVIILYDMHDDISLSYVFPLPFPIPWLGQQLLASETEA